MLMESRGKNVISIIGIDRYAHWNTLKNAVSDAKGALEIFQSLGFVQLAAPLFDARATSSAIRSLVSDDLMCLSSQDNLVLFYAGHGGTRNYQLGDRTVKTGYIIPVDASNEHNRTSSLVDIESWLRTVSLLPARHIIVILDACHSGVALDPITRWRDIDLAPDGSLSALYSRRSRRVITSALDDQAAMDSGPIFGHSLFTGCLIEALTHGTAEHATLITGSALGVHLQRRVEQLSDCKQTPDFGSFAHDDRGELIMPILRPFVNAATPAAKTDAAGQQDLMFDTEPVAQVIERSNIVHLRLDSETFDTDPRPVHESTGVPAAQRALHGNHKPAFGLVVNKPNAHSAAPGSLPKVNIEENARHVVIDIGRYLPLLLLVAALIAIAIGACPSEQQQESPSPMRDMKSRMLVLIVPKQ